MPQRAGRIHDTRRPPERRPRHDFVGAQHAAPAEEPARLQPHTTVDAPASSSCSLLGGRSFSSDINPALSSVVLTPEARFSADRLQVSNA
jgi:hypothetical protein